MLFSNVCKLNLNISNIKIRLISSRNGTTWSGYFAALCNAIDRMQTEQIIDPFKTVRLLRANREQFINQVKLFSIKKKQIDLFCFLESI
jgi:hypothetical protein